MSAAPRNNSKNRPWQPGGVDGVSFGTWLRRQREAREITLREIADNSKISLRYLEAFEQDRFDILPAPIFSRGFLQEYAKFVGLDPDEVVNHYLSAQQALEPEEDEELEAAANQRPPKASWLPGFVLVLAAVAALVLIIALVAFYTDRHRKKLEAEEGASESASPPVAQPSTTVPAALPPLDQEVVEESAEPSAAPPQTDPQPAAPAEPEVPLLVELRFQEDCWVEIRADGRRFVSELKRAQDVLEIPAQRSVTLTMGNPGGVAVRVNGRPYDLGLEGRQVARGIQIDLETARSLVDAS